ncbi:MAG: sulfotransferase domain-containing protein [Nocardioidaceae bacterium]
MPVERRGPSFLYIGTSKAGSTWLFNALSIHPEVFLASNKGLYYFDQHFDNGEPWYLDQFADSGDRVAAGEISHSYLSSPDAPARIVAMNPAMRLLVCLREPVDRAFSDYLDLLKNMQYDGSFEGALQEFPRLVERGHYASHLRHYLEAFPREQIHVGFFDDLRSDPQAYAEGVFRFLGVTPLMLPPAALKSRMPAGAPRNATAAASAKAASQWVKRAGLRRVRSRVKRSVLLRQALYRPYKDDRPRLDPESAARLRAQFAGEIRDLDNLLEVPVSRRWGYGTPTREP